MFEFRSNVATVLQLLALTGRTNDRCSVRANMKSIWARQALLAKRILISELQLHQDPANVASPQKPDPASSRAKLLMARGRRPMSVWFFVTSTLVH